MMDDIIFKEPAEINVLNQIKSAFPSYTNEMAETALLLLKARTSTLEMAFDEYIERYHPNGIAERDAELPDKYKGYIEFLRDNAAAILHAGKSADFSTFIHECAHVFRRQLTGELKESAEKAFNIQNGKWTVGQEEYFAKGLEQWIILKAAKNKGVRNRDKQVVYEKAARFVNNVYKGLEHIIDITPEMEAVYEKLFENDNKFNQKEYEDILHNIADDKPPDASHVYLGMTPRIYEEFGFERLPMMITGKHLYSTLRKDGFISASGSQNINYHDLGEYILRQIPEQLKKPVAVIQSDSDERDIVSIIELRDKNNNPVIVPLQQFAKRNVNEIQIDGNIINLVKSIYGKSNFENWINTAVDDGRLLFIDKKRTAWALSRTNQPQQSPFALRTRPNVDELQDLYGFFINNILRYREYVKQHSRYSAIINGKRLLFQPDVNQLAFDFDNEPETAPQAQKTVEAKQFIPETPKPDTAAETAAPEDSADVDTPDFRFTPTVSPDGKTFDFTGVPANKIYLVSQKNILSKERPSWIPEWDINFMNKSAFIPPFLNRGGHFEIVTEKADYLLTPEVFTASIDYYMKYKKQLNQDRANAVNQEFFDKAKDMFIAKFYRENKEADSLQKYAVSDFDISWDKKKVGSRNDQMHSLDVTVKTKDGAYTKTVSVFPSSFNTRIYESKFDLGNLYQNIFYPIKAERVNLISKTSMTHKQAALYKNSGLSTKEMWKQWEGDRELIDQKLLDMQGHLDDYRSVYIKGKETSYGDANLNDSLLEKYGVMVKRQNGDPIDKEEISQIETAIQTVTKVFGNVRDISREYGLKISHSSDKLMHASKYTGIFTPYYKSLGVSFKQEDIAPFIMAHEYAHFLDAFAGKEEKRFFSSDIKGSPEYNIAGLFRDMMNAGENSSQYYRRTCECFARAMEQYAAYKTNSEAYKYFCSMDYYCKADDFEKIIPEIEKLIDTRQAFWKVKTAENENYIDVVNNDAETIISKKPAGELSIYDNFLSDFTALAKNGEYSTDKVEAARHLLRTSYAPFKQNVLQEMKERGGVSPETSRAYLLNVLYEAGLEKESKKPLFPEEYRPYGAWLGWNKRLSERQRMEVNNKVLELLQKNSAFSEEEKNTLRLYSGFGGINADDERGVLYDYYTSPPLARLTWRMLDKIEPLKTGERVLEPSCGTGVFIDNAPDGLLCSGVELDKRTAAVASALQNKAAVFNMSFEQFNLSDAAGGFDRVIGNAPFGARPADVAELDMPEEKSLDNYFVSRSLDNLKDGGTLAVITAPGLLNNKSNENFRRELSKKAQFIGAVQLPNKSFYHTHTNVQPAVLFFKKYPRDIERRMKAIDDKTFQTTSLYDRNFAEASYFKAYPHHVIGELSEGTGQFGGDEIIGELTQEGIDNILLSFTPAYQHDDVTFDELRQIYALPDDKERDSVPLSSDEVSLLKADKLPSIKIFNNTLRVLSNDSRWEFLSDDKTFIDKVERTARLASTVTSVREAMKAGNDDIKLHQSAARAILDAYKADFGCCPLDDKDIRRLVNKYPAVKGVYDAFITPSSEILTSASIYASDIEIVDGHNPAVKALVDLQNALIPATEENIKDRFPENAESLIEEMFVNNDIFYTPKGVWQLREDFISGDAWQKIDMLRASAASTENDRIKEKLLYGAAELEKAVGWTPVEEADISPRSSWLDEEIIRGWASSKDGLDHHELTKLAKNNEGKWGITEESIWQEYPHPLVYYLNGQKQRSPYIDTKVYNEEHDELFKAFISNHPGHRQSIEQTYNRLFKTYLTSPVKTYPVEIKGWQNAQSGHGKTLNPHQWQTIHHLYRQGSGISALGTGFGKTASAVGLMSLLRQEGKLSRVWLQAPNNKVKDWIAEIKDVMPSLKIASIDPEEPGYGSRDKRYARYRQIANSKADIIIMPESAASEIQLKKDNDAVIREKIAGDYKTEKIISNASKRQTAAAELKGLSDTQNGKTNRTINFEDFGCDAVFVDEAHNYKNLFSSGLSRETGINDGRQSAKAMSLFKKTDFIRENNNGKNVFLLTATPLTNSPLEYYNMLQFIASDELKRFSIMSIDGFIREFADVKEGIRYDWTKNSAGWGKILSGFKNLQTLQELFFKYTDLQNNPEAVGLEKPEPYNMPNLIPSDKDQIAVLKSISDEIERYRSLEIEDRKAEYPGQNFLTFYSQMRTASLDLELFDPDTYKNWKNPKLEKLAANVKSIFDNTSGGQVVFCDRIFDSNAQFNLHDKIKSSLVSRGFNESEIVIINGFTKSGDKRPDGTVEKDVSKAIEGYNSGKYKVIIGTTACIGEGVNLQKNSSAVHHFDIPFRPSDFIQRNGRVDRQGNKQEKVELHTYLASGTIDNYSVALVQNKADWIDKLLRTKSSVFTNPDDENSVDMNELLLSLTEEWGDKEKAGAMREELRRQKEDAEREAWDKKMRDNIRSLSLLRNAIQSVKNKDGADYKNRLDKIHNLERALSDNPLFNKPDLLGSLEPFLYNAKNNTVIRKDDILIRQNLETVTGFDFKKQRFFLQSVSDAEKKDVCPISKAIFLVENENLSYREQSYNPVKHHFEKPDKDLKPLLQLLDKPDAFYGFHDKDLVRDYYYFHLSCFSSWHSDNHSEPPVFNIDEDGGLSITSAYRSKITNGVVDALNPFIDDDKQKIIGALKTKPKIDYRNSISLIKKHFPDIYQNLAPHLISELHDEDILDEITAAKQQKITDYRKSGFARGGKFIFGNNPVLQDKNIISKEKEKMEEEEKLEEQPGSSAENGQAGNPAEKQFSPEVMADPAAKALAAHGAAEWRTVDGKHRLYFDFNAKKKLYGLSTAGTQELSPLKEAEFREQYNSKFLPRFPEKAWHNGKPISPDKAFQMLMSQPYYDMNQKKMIGLLQDVQTRNDYLKQRSLDMGGKEVVNAEKGTHRIYFNNAAAIKNLYGLDTKGKTELSPEDADAAREKFPYTKYLPDMPESATLRGEPVDPKHAFDLLASRPYFDVKTGYFELAFSKEQTFDMYIAKEFKKEGVSEDRKAELAAMVSKHDAQIRESSVLAAARQIRQAKQDQEIPYKDMTPSQQLKAFLADAVEQDNVPWEKGFNASAALAPFNFLTRNQFSRSNLIAASLHMAHIGSKDPRYMTEDQIQNNGLAVDEKAIPLKVAYRTQAKDGAYRSKTVNYYNAKDIPGLPALQLPKSLNELSPPVMPERPVNIKDQIVNNMAAFIAALSSNRSFQPINGAIKKQDYMEFSAMEVNDLFSNIQTANSRAMELTQDPKERQQQELGRQAAGMEM